LAELERARVSLEAGDYSLFEKDILRADIRDSWLRCLEFGLIPANSPRDYHLTTAELSDVKERNEEILRVAGPELRNLRSQIAGRHYRIALASPDAVLLDVVVDRSFSKSENSELAPGVCWKECARGTNALGTTAVVRRAASVHGPEHFFRAYSHLTCMASPIFDPAGQLLGLLDVTCDYASGQGHAAALVQMSALHIESEIFREKYKSNAAIVQFHSRKEFASTLDAGLIAMDLSGEILQANRQALWYLGNLRLKIGGKFAEAFQTRIEDVLACGKFPNESCILLDQEGSSYIAFVSTPHSNNIAAAVQRPTKPPCVSTSQHETIGTPRPRFVALDPAVASAVEVACKAARMRVPILIRGESGTGKELLAEFLHEVSGRKGNNVALNCAAVPGELIEAELFGYQEGAFTGARHGGSSGLIVEADNGTLFLDEIGDMPLWLQPTLLRLLDHWTVRSLGSVRERKVNVQLITATNRDLNLAIHENRFRSDLLHRIAAVEVHLPPLRERSDFAVIARTLVAQVAPSRSLTEGAIILLSQQSWEGNARELRNVLTRAAIFSDAQIISEHEIEAVLEAAYRPPYSEEICAATGGFPALRESLILETFRRVNGNISQTAKLLHVSRNTVYREVRKSK
jgi:transcriptional regulator of acetoin/glycerol metabolism